MVKHCEYDSNYYVSNLKMKDERRLTWDPAGQDSIVVQISMDQDLDMEFLCQKMNDNVDADFENDYEEVAQDMYVRFISAKERAKKGGCDINQEGYRYFVLACRRENDDIMIYSPNETKYRNSYYDVPLRLNVKKGSEVITIGKLWNKEKITFYYLAFELFFQSGYCDGDLYYTVKIEGNEYRIPITTDMLKAGRIYIESYEPVLGSKGSRIKYTEQ